MHCDTYRFAFDCACESALPLHACVRAGCPLRALAEPRCLSSDGRYRIARRRDMFAIVHYERSHGDGRHGVHGIVVGRKRHIAGTRSTNDTPSRGRNAAERRYAGSRRMVARRRAQRICREPYFLGNQSAHLACAGRSRAGSSMGNERAPGV